MTKAYWQSKWVFILAAIGSAAGLGNIWRFPFQVYDNGGWAFIFAYLVILLFIGLGLLVAEVALGQKTTNGAPGAYGSISSFFRWLGWFAVLGSATVLTYYIVIIGWGMDYFAYSLQGVFSGQLPWAADSSAFFFKDILGITDGINIKGELSIPVLLGVVASWLLLYLVVFKSVHSVGRVVVYTASLPFLTLFGLMIYALTLPGATLGMEYLTTVDWSALKSLDVWTAAAGQIFFTLSLAFGAMIAYGAFKQDRSEIVKSTVMVALGNTLISFLSAIAVFAGLGYLATTKGVDIAEVAAGGPSLVFVIFPEIFATIGGHLGAIISFIFFTTIFLLAIDSAIALFETVSKVIMDKFPSWKIEIVSLILMLVLGAISVTYIFGNGLYVLDIIDYHITTWLLIPVGLISAGLFFVGSFQKTKGSLTEYIAARNDWTKLTPFFFRFSWLLSFIVLVYLVILNLKAEGGYGGYTEEALEMYGLYPLIVLFGISILLNILTFPYKDYKLKMFRKK